MARRRSRASKTSKKYLVSFLRVQYHIFNRLLFSSKLPKVPIYLGDLGPEYRGVTVSTGSEYWIVINDTDPNPVKVLLHEMTHVYHDFVLKIKSDTQPEGRKSDHPPSFVRLLRSRYKKLGWAIEPGELG